MASLQKIAAAVFLLLQLFALCGGARVKLARKQRKVASLIHSESNQQATTGECEMSSGGQCKIYASAGSDPSCKALAGTYYWKVPDAQGSNTFRVMPKKYSSFNVGLTRDGVIMEKSEVPSYSIDRYPEEFTEKAGQKMLPHPDKKQYGYNLLIPDWEESSSKVIDPAECMRIVCMSLGTEQVGPSLSELLMVGGGKGNLHAGKLGGDSASGGWVVTEKQTGALVACQYQDETKEGSRKDNVKYSFTVRAPLVDSWTFADDADVSPVILAPVTLKTKVGATMGMGDGIDEVWESELTCEDGAWDATSFMVYGTGGGGGTTFDRLAQGRILPYIPESMNGKGPELPPYRSTAWYKPVTEEPESLPVPEEKKEVKEAEPGLVPTGQYYPLEALQKGCPEGVQPSHKEQALSDEDFKATFKITKEEFSKLAGWKQQAEKKKVSLY